MFRHRELARMRPRPVDAFVKCRRRPLQRLQTHRTDDIGDVSELLGASQRLTAAQVQSRLDDLTPAQLRKVRDYERRNANRKSVLNAIEKALA